MSMRVAAAYMLAVLGGNDQPTQKDVKKILKAVDAEFEDEHLTLLLEQLEGKNVYDVIAEGKSKLGSVPTGGAASSAGASSSAAPAAEEKKAEVKEESEESEEEMGFGGLF
ncbi:large subunit ribosomal protein LP2 [Acrasis kona]|uniref:Large subunit ribosomal protein LP2 n=1 Tax=Acrasis kona TaxID=1008807 RepID=A0AAW2YSE3_9EUKA